MTDREELAALRRLVELEAKRHGSVAVAEPHAAPAPPSTGSVAINAAMKGLAGIPDAILNTPANLGNLAKMAYATGRPEVAANTELFQPPNVVRRGMEHLGAIRNEAEPQTPMQRIVDTAVQGGAGMVVSPAQSVKQALTNVALGVTGGTAAGTTKELTGSDLAALAAGIAVPGVAKGGHDIAVRKVQQALATQSQNAVRDATLRAAQSSGYVVPPSTVRPSFGNERLESIAGRAAVLQEAGKRNQMITNKLANQELALPENTPLTVGKLEHYREQVSAPYTAIADLSHRAASTLDKLKQTRRDANRWFMFGSRDGNPEVLDKASSLQMKADQYEQRLETMATKAGKPELVEQLREARQKIAKSYDIERALNVGDANVDAKILGRALDKGRPFTGNLELIGKFAEGPGRQVTREAAAIPTPGVSGTDAGASALLGTLGYGAAQGPAGLAAAGLPLLRSPARSLALSPFYQRHFATPQYNPSMMTQMMASLPAVSGREAVIKSLLLGRALAER